VVPIRVGVIGLGRMGQHHCRVYSNQMNIQLVGVFDINHHLASNTSNKFGVKAFRSLEELLACVDAVSVATPTPTHFDIVMQCIEHKTHVLVEKPITEKTNDAEYIARCLCGNELILQVGHIERFNPTYHELKKVLKNLTIIAVNFRRLSPYRVSNTDVDVVLDLMVHDLDLCNDLTDRRPTEINAHGLMPFSNTLDHVIAQLVYDNGPLISLTASRVTEQKIRSIDITTEDAYIEADLMNKSISIHRNSTGEFLGKNHNEVSYHQESLIERILVPNVEPLASEIQSFINSIYKKSLPQVSIYNGLEALVLAHEICLICNGHFPLHFNQSPSIRVQETTNT
jgi:predicted dehydrogenase